MFKKLRAAWRAAVAVVVVCIIIILLSVAIPVLLGLIAIGIVSIIGYVTYQANKDS